jgi:hypothetical protein
MINVNVLKNLLEIDEWVSDKKNYSYCMNVDKYSVNFWIYNHTTDKGIHVSKVSEIDEKILNHLEGVQV